MRESAFNLIADWAGTVGEPADDDAGPLQFLDLYGGTGAVALEAASRGAGPVVCVEKDRAHRGAGARQRDGHGPGRAGGRASSVDAYLAGTPHTFDVVWFDPPYDVPTAVVDAQVAVVVDRWLAPDGLVVVERSSRDTPPSWPISSATCASGVTVRRRCTSPTKEDDA